MCFLNKKIKLNRIRIESARVRGSNKDGRDVFSRFLKMAKDSAARIIFANNCKKVTP